MNHKTKITLEDSFVDIITKMSDGNPGALNALMEIFKHGDKIDPDSFSGGLSPMLSLDSHGIYGTDIYILYSDICNKQVNKMIAVLRSVQLGLFSESILKDACSRQDRSGASLVPVEELYNKVKERLPKFDN